MTKNEQAAQQASLDNYLIGFSYIQQRLIDRLFLTKST